MGSQREIPPEGPLHTPLGSNQEGYCGPSCRALVSSALHKSHTICGPLPALPRLNNVFTLSCPYEPLPFLWLLIKERVAEEVPKSTEKGYFLLCLTQTFPRSQIHI
jgi:hypothetical protein